jgi:hypothetical protein
MLLGAAGAALSYGVIPAESKSSATYIEAYKAVSAASRKAADAAASSTYVYTKTQPVPLATQSVHSWRIGMDANGREYMPDRHGRECQTHATAIGKNNGTQARHFKNREVHDQFYELVLRIYLLASHGKQVNLDLSAVCVILI